MVGFSFIPETFLKFAASNTLPVEVRFGVC